MTHYSLPHLNIIGTNYDVGKAIGYEFKDRIKQYLNDFDFFNTKILPFIETENGKLILNDYLNLIKKKFPWYIDEINGIADGSGLSFDWVNLQIYIINF